MEVINGSGEYVSKKSGQKVSYTYEFVSFASLAEMTEALGEDKVIKLAQRMIKVDASNTAREGAKIKNGDSTRKAMSEQDKAQAKQKRAEDKALLDRIKTLTPEQRTALGL